MKLWESNFSLNFKIWWPKITRCCVDWQKILFNAFYTFAHYSSRNSTLTNACASKLQLCDSSARTMSAEWRKYSRDIEQLIKYFSSHNKLKTCSILHSCFFFLYLPKVCFPWVNNLLLFVTSFSQLKRNRRQLLLGNS